MKAVLFLFLSVLSLSASAGEQWGGRGLELHVEAGTAKLTFDCAEGTVIRNWTYNGSVAGLIVHAKGAVSLSGPKPELAVYTVKRSGNLLQIKVQTKNYVNVFTLRKDTAAELYPCLPSVSGGQEI